jgi:hypothetical protein
MTQATPGAESLASRPRLIHVTVIGQEADEAVVTLNPNAPCSQLLQKGLHALYGEPGPAPSEYDVVLGGKPIEPLSQKLEDIGIGDGTSVSILPKSISRGSR